MTSTPTVHPQGLVPEPDAAAFPPGFTWGVATSSYQIEGAVDADSRGPSIWDTFSDLPGRTMNGDTGRVAVEHYERWAEDLGLMSSLGVDAYRFSVAWPRIQPSGTGPANRAGLDFYSRLVDELLGRGITPWVTLYHWDLPEALESAGGWPHRDTAARFADYARIVAESLGDRVKRFITLNEPWCAAFLGYGSGIHAPGRSDPGAAVTASHHLLLGHGLAASTLRECVPDAQVGITLNLYPVVPAHDEASPGDHLAHADAVRRIDGLANRWFLDPVLRGHYPEDVLADLEPVIPAGLVQAGDGDVISAPLDFLGVNYYTRHVVGPSPYPGASTFEFRHRDAAHTDMGWEIHPDGLVEVLERLHREYPPIPLVITENGAAFRDEPDALGRVRDDDRVSYLARHISAAATACSRGVPLIGYFAWSLMDNFEWAEGLAKRFGLTYVDYATQARTLKDSGRWYAGWIRRSRSATHGVA